MSIPVKTATLTSAAPIAAAAATPAKDWGRVDPDIDYRGKAITLPDDPSKMPLKAAIETLQRKAADEEQETAVIEWIDTYPMDGAVSFNAAMKAIYGWASPVPEMTFFGPKPPQLRSIKTGPNPEDVVQVPWGSFRLPNVEGEISTKAAPNEGRMMFVIVATVKKKDAYIVKELAAKTREILATGSIYKNKALRLRTNEDGNLDMILDPEFLPTQYINPGELVLNPGEGDQIETALWTPIRHTDACVQHKIPLKRGILLEGPYGCGKSMTANVTSKVAVDNGWTFILLDDVRALKDALLFAKRYSPAVVFAEDADRVAAVRDERGNDLLNTIDGILSKDSKVITVLTTNFVEKLDVAMLRPGRLDAVISVKAPDAEAVQKLVSIYARGLLEDGTDLAAVGTELAGNIPATIREVVERAKLGMIGRAASTISADDLLVSARGMKDHLALLKPKAPVMTNREMLGFAVEEVLRDAVRETGLDDGFHKKIQEIHDHVA